MLEVAAVFSNHMVLQRRKRIAIWGNSDSKKVQVTLYMDTAQVTVCQTPVKREWYVELPPQEAGGPYRLEISTGTERLEFVDVMVGEVWLAGGQSNMEFELQNCKGGSDIVLNAKPGDVRFYYTPKVAWLGEEHKQAEAESTWELFEPDACAKWSAVGYFFAKRIADELGVTVGVIGCNWGGTSASCWMGRAALEEHASLNSYLKEYDDATKGMDEEAYLKAHEEYLVYQQEFDRKVGEYYQSNPDANWDEAISLFGENRYPGPMGPRNFTRPYGLYETMIKRVAPYTIAGFIYYQGEEDDHKPYTYATLLSALIAQWRADWKDDTLPFLIVQLPIFRNEGEEDFQNWPFIREAQMRVFETVKNTGIAVALELGEDRNIHPLDKRPVGERLALQALWLVYHRREENQVFGPIYKDYFSQNGQLVLEFEHADDGVRFLPIEDLGFEVAAEDKMYYPANAKSDGNRITLWSEKVEKPAYARYCWNNYRQIGVFGKNGIPLAPFRTSMLDGAKANGSRQGRLIS